jgi:hypothetical protein
VKFIKDRLEAKANSTSFLEDRLAAQLPSGKKTFFQKKRLSRPSHLLNENS